MQRVLDLDLDFFLDDVADSRPYDGPRLSANDYYPWEIAKVVSFLRDRCLLDGRLPGVAVENHGEVFGVWRGAIDEGRLVAPFHVTHVDANADLGANETGHRYLLTDLMHADPAGRRHPRVAEDKFSDGSYLAFAAACRWLSELVYVCYVDPDYACSQYQGPFDGKPRDLHPWLMEGFTVEAENIRLAPLTEEQFSELYEFNSERPRIETDEPRIPFHRVPWPDFYAHEPFDFIFLARSPAYTPASADPIFDEIRRLFIDERTFAVK
ncbi:MAG: hypothetical protein ACXVHQ_41490 [Solirubrobacteraceae bacterium]